MPVGSAIASIGSSVIGGIVGSGAANKAGQEVEQAAQQGVSTLQGVQQQSTSNLQPYALQGQQYNSELAGLLGLGGNQAASQQAFQNWLGSTNYQFELGQGLQGVEYANAPAFSSSATAKALNNYAQGQAGQYLGNYEGLLQTGAGQGIQAGIGLANANTQNALGQAQTLLTGATGEANAGLIGANQIQGALRGINSGLSSFSSAGGGSALAGLFGGGQYGGSSAATGGGLVDIPAFT